MGTCGRLVRLTHPHSHAVCVGRGVKRREGKGGREMGRTGAGSRAIRWAWSSPSAGMSSTVRARCRLCEVLLRSCLFFFLAHSRSEHRLCQPVSVLPMLHSVLLSVFQRGRMTGLYSWLAGCPSVRLSVFSCHSSETHACLDYIGSLSITDQGPVASPSHAGAGASDCADLTLKWCGHLLLQIADHD